MVTRGVSGNAGGSVGFVHSRPRDTASQNRLSEIRPEAGPEEGIDERLLRELAERVRCERLRHNLQRPADPQTGGCSLRSAPAGTSFAHPPQSECRRRAGRPDKRTVHRSPGGVNAIPPSVHSPRRSNAPRRSRGRFSGRRGTGSPDEAGPAQPAIRPVLAGPPPFPALSFPP